MAKKKKAIRKQSQKKEKYPVHKHGFGANPQNINKSGANKGSKWKSTLLKELLTKPVDAEGLEILEEFKTQFPTIFSSDDNNKNYQLLMELRQLQLVFDKNPDVAQRAMNAIKDRIDGKPKQQVKVLGKQDVTVSFK